MDLIGFRKRIGLDRMAVAIRLGVSQRKGAHWELGTRCPSDRQRAALALLYRVTREEVDRALGLDAEAAVANA